MDAFVKHTGLVAPLDRVNVDTDAIIPKQFLKRIERTGFGQFVFYDLRYDENGAPIKDFVLNKPRYNGASILLSRANFGCGSSREHAPWALLDYGFRVIIASSFADIFYNNCFNNGILLVKLSNSEIDLLMKNCEFYENYKLEVDLQKQKIRDIYSLDISFEINEFYKTKLLNGMDDISLTLLNEDKISKFEENYFVY